MPIVILPEEYIGQLLYVKPKYGWGWVRHDAPAISLSHAQVQELGGFQVRVRFLFGGRRYLRGLVGVVEQESHPLDGSWLGGYPRGAGEYNFTDRLAKYWDLHIGPSAPRGQEPILPTGFPVWAGHGIVAESADYIQDFQTKYRTVAA